MPRPIRQNELELLAFLLNQIQMKLEDFKISKLVDEYEGGKMGSISLGGDVNAYAGDLVKVEYTDVDGTDVVITLTKDDKNQLLDLDFWKVDFSKLLEYPTPDKVRIV